MHVGRHLHQAVCGSPVVAQAPACFKEVCCVAHSLGCSCLQLSSSCCALSVVVALVIAALTSRSRTTRYPLHCRQAVYQGHCKMCAMQHAKVQWQGNSCQNA